MAPSSHQRRPSTPPTKHLSRQLKFVVPGGVITYYLSVLHNLQFVLSENAGWGRTCALSSLLLGLLTISLFLYVLLIPWIKNEEPDFISWRESGVLSSVIPALTASIVIGWSLLAFTLGHWSNVGYPQGVVGALGIYALTFGLMGLIPAPKIRRR